MLPQRRAVIVEVYRAVKESAPGVVLRDEVGDVLPTTGVFYGSANDDIVGMSAVCESCGHQWRPRRPDRRPAHISADR